MSSDDKGKDSIIDNAAIETEERPRNIFNYFKASSSKASSCTQNSKSATEATKRKLQKDVHYCVVCHKTVSRGNQSTLKRHAKSNHKNDLSYDYKKSFFPEMHEKAVTASKEKEDTKAKQIKVTERDSAQEPNELELDESPFQTLSASNFSSTTAFDVETNPGQARNDFSHKSIKFFMQPLKAVPMRKWLDLEALM